MVAEVTVLLHQLFVQQNGTQSTLRSEIIQNTGETETSLGIATSEWDIQKNQESSK